MANQMKSFVEAGADTQSSNCWRYGTAAKGKSVMHYCGETRYGKHGRTDMGMTLIGQRSST